MAHVTYLLGAGASAACLPVVNRMAEDLTSLIKNHSFIDPIEGTESRSLYGVRVDYRYAKELVMDDLTWIKEACLTHYSIDTFAKKLYLTNAKEFERLKLALSFYFTFKQILSSPDIRYDNFWASILNEEDKFPNKIKILSWNYDFQLEQSYMNISSAKSINDAEQKLNMLNLDIQSDFKIDRFGIVKLNGSARVYSKFDKRALYLCDYSGRERSEMAVKQLIYNYGLMKSVPEKFDNKLFFAWEQRTRNLMDASLYPFIENTRVLVVIGYSFPFFNRDLDKRILSSMKNLTTVYIQDKYPETIKERVSEILNTGITYKLVSDTSQFAFPRELDVSV
jgi:hypothetical protein